MNQHKDFNSGLGLLGLEHLTAPGLARLLLKYKWTIGLAALLTGIIAAGVAHFIPNRYRSSTVIMVDPRKVSDNFVAPTVSSGIADRMATIRQHILSSSNLSTVINDFNLYPDLRSKKTPEELVKLMTRDIDVQVAPPSSDRGEGTFKISFQATDPQLAARVANRLAEGFIKQNVAQREDEVQGASEFIDRELLEAKQDLQQKEDKIRQIKSQYASDLPESQQMHVQALNSLQLDLRSEEDAINRAQQQKVYYQSQLINEPQVVNLDGSNENSGVVPLQVDLAKAQIQLDNLRTRYGANHPDVVKKTGEIKELEKRIRQAKADNSERTPVRTAAKPHNPVLESQIAAIDDEIKARAKRESDIKEKIAYHQSKLERIPVLEQQLASINRDYENARDHYKVLMDRKFAADMSSSLENFNKDDRFVVLDPAQAPARPFSPNRPLISFAGLAFGLFAGLSIVLGREMLDPSVKTAQEIKNMFGVTVLAEIPELLTQMDLRKQRLHGSLGAVSCFASVIVFAVITYISA
ncbi:MAG TPA: XrtA system polysaccharide chain length determinant [Candidatus Angelobacter sp.]|nr:XrtA system polysaccharide chain length determinant [Candidatus Angelobacter sp.]